MVLAKARLLLSHVPRQAEPHDLRETAHLEFFLYKASCFLQHIAGACWALAMGTVRFRHLQRSKLLKLGDEVIAVACNKDKNPKRDASPGYVWILPRKGLAYEGSGEKFWNSVQGAIKVTESKADFLLFDLHPRGCQPQEATSFGMQEMS